MKNGTSLGSDGFTVEFYNFLWNDLGSFLVRAINEKKTRKKVYLPSKGSNNYIIAEGRQATAVSKKNGDQLHYSMCHMK